jgi:hypothetical protein
MASVSGGMPLLARLPALLAWTVAASGAFLLLAAPATADQNPPGCTQNNLALDIGRDRTIVRNGDSIRYTISASNLDSAQGPACHLTATTFFFIAPGADGTPTGAKTVLRANVDFPAGTTRTVLGTVPYVVAVNPGVTDTIAEAGALGTLHDAPVNDLANVVKSLGSTVTQPHSNLTVSVTTTGSTTPVTAQFTYVERNDGSTPAPIVSVTVTDDGCSPVTYVTGDANNNHVLDPGEAWSFTCKRIFTKAGVFTEHVSAAGVNTADNLAAPLESAQVSVTARAAFVIPVTGPTVPLGPAAALAFLLIGGGVALLRRGLAQQVRCGPWDGTGRRSSSSWTGGTSVSPTRRRSTFRGRRPAR